jgi:hypothetical protein
MFAMLWAACTSDTTDDKPEEDTEDTEDTELTDEDCDPIETASEPLTCDGDVPACGGDLVGTWAVGDWCADGTYSTETTYGTSSYCPGMVIGYAFSLDSLLTFADDQTYDFETTAEFLQYWELPQGCLYALELADCAETAELLNEDYGAYTITCAEEPEIDCRCEWTIHVRLSGDGLWETCGGRLTMSEDLATGSTYTTYQQTTTTTTFGPYDDPYCIDGDVLRLEHEDDFLLGGVYTRL